MAAATAFYDDVYFERQSQHGELQAQANLFKFARFVTPDGNLLDFGCGGGFLLAALRSADRIGIEINPVAAAHARSIGITKVFPDLSAVDSAWADCIVSDHALEHVENPIEAMRGFFRVLKPDGLLVIVTPYDRVSFQYRDDDQDRHLFGWSPSNMGNLARTSGFEIVETRELCHKWPPKWHLIWKHLGPAAFHLSCRIFGRLRPIRTQVRLVAKKPVE